MPIDFLAIGNITQDRVPGGFRLGGTVSYASIAAMRLGRQPGILTRAAAGSPGLDDSVVRADAGSNQWSLSGIQVFRLPSPVTTTFSNIYDSGGRRIQIVEAIAPPVLPGDLPPSWADASLVLLGPIAGEVPPAWASAFPGALLGVMAQGLLRAWDASGHVHPCRWPDAEVYLRRADAVIFSQEDVQGDMAYVAELAGQTRILALTQSRQGCTVFLDGVPHPVTARPAREVDPTGAGDVFTAAFLIRLAETGDPLAAAHFANVAASISVEGQGMAGIPYRAQVDREL